MSESNMSSWDRERIRTVLTEAFASPGDNGYQDSVGQALSKLTDLLGSVRAEAIGWTWTEACSQYDRGMDPRRSQIPELLERASADLNPERE